MFSDTTRAGESPPAGQPLLIVTDDLDNAVEGAWTAANKPLPGVSTGEKILNKIGDHVLAGAGLAQHAPTAQYVATNLVDGFNIDMNAVKEGLRTFQQASEIVMKGLDGVAQIHPFVGIAVVAFKAVVTLELKRRENNGKVLALHLEMRDTMSMLLQLRSVQDDTDKMTLKGRMQTVLQKLAEDIKMCGNVCDKYMKKSTIAKIIKAPIYEQKLADCGDEFIQRRKELKMAMAIHTTLGVDAANRSLATVQQNTKSLDDKVSMILVFQRLNSSRDRDLMKWIEENGGADKIMKDDELMKKLQKKADSMQTAPTTSGVQKSSGPSEGAVGETNIAEKVQALRKELREDFDEGLTKNMVTFERKLEVQTQQLEKALRVESDRVIYAIRSGAHERVVDNTLRQLWKDMGWKGSVKARHLVLCLHEYFSEKNDQQEARHHASVVEDSMNMLSPAVSYGVADDDAWTLDFINVVHVPPIIENMDDNLSGFVSIKEANTFALARPYGWSFPHWLAYWAAAWPQSIEVYREKIYVIVQRMYNSLPDIRLDNRQSIENYLDLLMSWVEYILRSVNTSAYASGDSVLLQKCQPYIDSEEKRMKDTLESIKYDIDAVNTVGLITGPGRIEKFLFPLLYLLIRHHWSIFKLAQRCYLSPEDLQTMYNSLENVLITVSIRVEILTAVFKQSAVDVKSHFRSFAFGMFEAYSDDGGDLSDSNITFSNYRYDDGWLDDEVNYSIEDSSQNSATMYVVSDFAGADGDDTQLRVHMAATKDTEGTLADDINPGNGNENNALPTTMSAEEPEATTPKVIPDTDVNQADEPIEVNDAAEVAEGPGSGPNKEEDSSAKEEAFPGVLGETEERTELLPTSSPPLPLFNVLKNPPAYPVDTGLLDVGQTFSMTPIHSEEVQFPQVVEGLWTGYRAYDDPDPGQNLTPSPGLTTFIFEPPVDGLLKGTAQSHYGMHELAGEVQGVPSSEAPLVVKFSNTCISNAYYGFVVYHNGVYDPLREIIEGFWGYSDGDRSGTFTLSRTPAWLARYHVKDPSESRAKDLWAFVRGAAIALVRNKLFTASYQQERATERKRFVDINLKRRRVILDYGPLIDMTSDEIEEIDNLERIVPPAEGHFFQSIVDMRVRQFIIHSNAYCDECGRKVLGMRFMCVQCNVAESGSQIDLCRGCRDTTPVTAKFKHEHTHDLLLTYSFLHNKDRRRTIDNAIEQVTAIRSNFKRFYANVGPDDSRNDEEKEKQVLGLTCWSCQDALRLPCWVCVDSDCALCESCAMKEPPVRLDHRYVRIYRPSVFPDQSKASSANSHESKAEERMKVYEEQLSKYQATIDARLNEMESKLSLIEALLRALVPQ